jgi:hypothetical protein
MLAGDKQPLVLPIKRDHGFLYNFTTCPWSGYFVCSCG